MEKICFLILLPVLWLSCSSQDAPTLPEHIKGLDSLTVYPAEAQPTKKIQLTNELAFGSSAEVSIGSVGGFDVDKKGRVFIADSRQNTIHVFDPDGSYRTHVGQKGRGPGEFVYTPIPNIISGRLNVYSPMQMRMSIFSVDSLDLIQTINLNLIKLDDIEEIAGFYISQIFYPDDRTFLVCFSQLNSQPPKIPGEKIDHFRRQFYIINSEGRIISDKIIEQKGRPWLTATIDGRVQMATTFHS